MPEWLWYFLVACCIVAAPFIAIRLSRDENDEGER